MLWEVGFKYEGYGVGEVFWFQICIGCVFKGLFVRFMWQYYVMQVYVIGYKVFGFGIIDVIDIVYQFGYDVFVVLWWVEGIFGYYLVILEQYEVDICSVFDVRGCGEDCKD